jgi:hypothetical protein
MSTNGFKWRWTTAIPILRSTRELTSAPHTPSTYGPVTVSLRVVLVVRAGPHLAGIKSSSKLKCRKIGSSCKIEGQGWVTTNYGGQLSALFNCFFYLFFCENCFFYLLFSFFIAERIEGFLLAYSCRVCLLLGFVLPFVLCLFLYFSFYFPFYISFHLKINLHNF